MTINTLKEYHDLVQAVAAAAGISTEQATRATYTVLTVSGSDLIWTPHNVSLSSHGCAVILLLRAGLATILRSLYK